MKTNLQIPFCSEEEKKTPISSTDRTRSEYRNRNGQCFYCNERQRARGGRSHRFVWSFGMCYRLRNVYRNWRNEKKKKCCCLTKGFTYMTRNGSDIEAYCVYIWRCCK